MSDLTLEQSAGQDRLKDVARYFAAQHGLRPEKIEWVEQYDGWWLTITTPEHSVKVVFSIDEIEDFAVDGDGAGAKGSKLKIRNAFASLTM